MEKQLPVSILFSPEFIFISLAVVFIGSLLSGLYPAFILSSFRPATVLKGSFSLQGKGSLLRKSLVVFQFVCSFFLIAGTFAVIKQVDFMREQKLGLNLNQVLVVKGPSNIERETFRGTFNSFKTEVKRMPEVKFASSSANIPGGGYDLGTTVRRMGADPTDSKSCNATWVDSEFIDTYELKLISGKDFSEASPEGPNGVIINETAIREFGLGDPQEALSHKLIIGRDTIIIRGVMEDYNWSGLQSEPPPVLLVYTRGSSSYYSFKVQTANIQETVASIEKLYKEMYPGNPYDYFFAEEFYNRQYKSEVQFAKIFGIFSSLAIMVACLGLLGLASYTATLRQKEVGIRKVLGADVSTIVYLFSGYFLKLMITATLIGFPLVYFGISNWLENFAYKISIGWEFFVLPSMALILLGFLAISFQTVKTALVNPSRTLRSE